MIWSFQLARQLEERALVSVPVDRLDARLVAPENGWK